MDNYICHLEDGQNQTEKKNRKILDVRRTGNVKYVHLFSGQIQRMHERQFNRSLFPKSP